MHGFKPCIFFMPELSFISTTFEWNPEADDFFIAGKR
jgi:hypothetical protein